MSKLSNVIKFLKVAGTVVVTAAVVEGGFVAGNILCDDTELTAKSVKQLIKPDPIVVKKHFWSKKKLVNPKTGKEVK